MHFILLKRMTKKESTKQQLQLLVNNLSVFLIINILINFCGEQTTTTTNTKKSNKNK